MTAFTVQNLLTQYFPAFKEKHVLPLYQIKAAEKLQACRTSKLGGHMQVCPKGHLNGIWYNSCKHRACPQCRGIQAERWLQRTRNTLIECPHHHIIFTVPHELNFLWLNNRQLIADVLFHAVQNTINTLSKDKKHLGAIPGYILALHTWGRNLTLHPHIHCLISHGGLNESTLTWQEPKRKSLFPAEPMRRLYRAKFIADLKNKLDDEKINLPESLSKQQFLNLLNKLGRQTWVVHCCPRYDHGDGVSKYLARYIRGGPFNNSQVLDIKKGNIVFRYLDHRTHKTTKMTLSVDDFLQRLLLHIPEPRKVLVRHYGLYHSKSRVKLNVARGNFKQESVGDIVSLDWQTYLGKLDGMPSCIECGTSLLMHLESEKKEVAEMSL